MLKSLVLPKRRRFEAHPFHGLTLNPVHPENREPGDSFIACRIHLIVGIVGASKTPARRAETPRSANKLAPRHAMGHNPRSAAAILARE